MKTLLSKLALIPVLLLLIAAKAPDTTPSTIKVYPGVLNEIVLSTRHMNMVQCHKNIKDRHFAKGSKIDVKLEGNTAYINFMSGDEGAVVKDGDKTISKPTGKKKYTFLPVTIYFTCDKKHYQILMQPEWVKAKTVILSRGQDAGMDENLKELSQKSEEDYLLDLITNTLTNRIPESFEVRKKNNWYHVYDDLPVQLKRTVHPSGTGFKVLDFTIKNTGKARKLTETDFHRREFSKAPVQILLDPHTLKTGEEGRLLIIERMNPSLTLPLFGRRQ